jgi:hypothetical protein
MDSFDLWETASVIYINSHVQILAEFVSRRSKHHAIPPSDEPREHDASDEGIVTPLTRDMIKAYVEFKYYYPGGSAWFMFDYVLEELKKVLKSLLASVKSNQ